MTIFFTICEYNKKYFLNKFKLLIRKINWRGVLLDQVEYLGNLGDVNNTQVGFKLSDLDQIRVIALIYIYYLLSLMQLNVILFIHLPT